MEAQAGRTPFPERSENVSEQVHEIQVTQGVALSASPARRFGDLLPDDALEPGALRTEKRLRGFDHLILERRDEMQALDSSCSSSTGSRGTHTNGTLAEGQKLTYSPGLVERNRAQPCTHERSELEALLRLKKTTDRTEYDRLVQRLSRLESRLPPAVSHMRGEASSPQCRAITSSAWYLPANSDFRDAVAAGAEASLVRLRATALLQELYLDQIRRPKTRIDTIAEEEAASKPSVPTVPETSAVEIIELSDDDCAPLEAATTQYEKKLNKSSPAHARTERENLVAGPARAQLVAELNTATDHVWMPSQAAHNLLRLVWNDHHDSREILVNRNGFRLSRHDLLRLRPGGWLSDAVLNAYCQHLLMERQLRESSRRPWPRCYIFSTFFYTRLLSGGHDRDTYDYAGVRRWTRCVDVFSFDRLLVPINLSNTHWALAMIEPHHLRLVYYDSLGGTGKGVLQTLLRWLQDEARDKQHKRIDTSAWKLTKPTMLPLQSNGNDCGVFAAAYAEHLTRGAPTDFPDTAIPWIRRRMCIELLCGHVPP